MRLFVALDPDERAREHLTEFLEPRWDAGDDLRWTRPESWHVTLAFAGDCPDDVAEALVEECADRAARTAPPTLRLAGVGAFPEVSRASLLYAAVHADPDLAPLAASVRRMASRLGAAPDGGRFVPHLSVARFRRPADATAWWRILETYAGPSWQPDGIRVVRSRLTAGGPPVHETLAVLPFG